MCDPDMAGIQTLINPSTTFTYRSRAVNRYANLTHAFPPVATRPGFNLYASYTPPTAAHPRLTHTRLDLHWLRMDVSDFLSRAVFDTDDTYTSYNVAVNAITVGIYKACLARVASSMHCRGDLNKLLRDDADGISVFAHALLPAVCLPGMDVDVNTDVITVREPLTSLESFSFVFGPPKDDDPSMLPGMRKRYTVPRIRHMVTHIALGRCHDLEEVYTYMCQGKGTPTIALATPSSATGPLGDQSSTVIIDMLFANTQLHEMGLITTADLCPHDPGVVFIDCRLSYASVGLVDYVLYVKYVTIKGICFDQGTQCILMTVSMDLAAVAFERKGQHIQLHDEVYDRVVYRDTLVTVNVTYVLNRRVPVHTSMATDCRRYKQHELGHHKTLFAWKQYGLSIKTHDLPFPPYNNPGMVTSRFETEVRDFVTCDGGGMGWFIVRSVAHRIGTQNLLESSMDQVTDPHTRKTHTFPADIHNLILSYV
ncbi:MAG: hypothetical protein JKY23_00390 [Nitrospinaceae bacterium]|nr:hypothetical protein [Nitrospinaceae bacterium]